MSTHEYARKHKILGLCRNCPRPIVDGSALFCHYHREKDRAAGRIKERKVAIKLREEILAQYGKVCSCCGESIIEFLTIEHNEGCGNLHRIKLFKYNVGGVHMYRWLKKNNFPKGFSVLCMNCNWAKRFSRICPHKK